MTLRELDCLRKVHSAHMDIHYDRAAYVIFHVTASPLWFAWTSLRICFLKILKNMYIYAWHSGGMYRTTFTSLHYLSSLFWKVLVTKYILGELLLLVTKYFLFTFLLLLLNFALQIFGLQFYQVYNNIEFGLMRVSMALYRLSTPDFVAVVCFALGSTSWH